MIAGKTVVALAVGGNHNLALCSDGSIAAWGDNNSGQLGNNSTLSSSIPVLVDASGALSGKIVTAISAGSLHSLALCSDGTVVAWGSNASGQLGNASIVTISKIPVMVTSGGDLAGKTIVAIAAGISHSLVIQTGVLAGKTVVGIEGGDSHCLAWCSDGSAVAWGNNTNGQLGNNSTTSSSVPVLIDTTAFRAGERFVSAQLGGSHSVAMAASPPAPVVATLAASPLLDMAATLNGSVKANGSASTSVFFDYGLTASYGSRIAATPGTVSGLTSTQVSASISGLLSGTIYHYRVIATSELGTSIGDDMTFTTTTFGTLTNLHLSSGSLDPGFAGFKTSYAATVPYAASSITVTPIAAYNTSAVTVNGASVPSGVASGSIDLAVGGGNLITIVVTSADGNNTTTYQVVVTRMPENLIFNSAVDVPFSVGDLFASGNAPPIVLNFPPLVGTHLTLVNNG